MKHQLIALLVVVAGAGAAAPGRAQTALFDFDSNAAGLTAGVRIPLLLASGAVTALFTSPAGSVFSLQSDATTRFRMSQFSGLYLYPDTTDGTPLDITFDRPLTAISLTFATADFQQVEVPTTLELTAYQDIGGSTAVATTTAHGTYAGDTMPMGTLSLTSPIPFAMVRLAIAPQANPAAGFLVDNIVGTPVASAQTRRVLGRVRPQAP